MKYRREIVPVLERVEELSEEEIIEIIIGEEG